jgi:hypothetical protein
VAKPAVQAMIAAKAKAPSPTVPKNPTKRTSCSLLICFEVVPDETSPWKPEIAPQAMVTNNSGIIGGTSSGRDVLNAGATTVGFENRTAMKKMPSPMKSWRPLM